MCRSCIAAPEMCSLTSDLQSNKTIGHSGKQSISQPVNRSINCGRTRPSLAFVATTVAVAVSDQLTITIASDSLIVNLVVGPQQCTRGYCWIQCAGQFALTSTSRISVPIGECARNGRTAIP